MIGKIKFIWKLMGLIFFFKKDNIESNVETSVDQTSKGVEELRAASKYQRSARTKMCILALILVIIAGVAVVTIYFLIPKK